MSKDMANFVNPIIRNFIAGMTLINTMVDKAREVGCHLVQLTMDKKHLDAIEFYKNLRFIPSHEGLKLHL